MSRFRHSHEEKLQAVMEPPDHSTTQTEICKIYVMYSMQLNE